MVVLTNRSVHKKTSGMGHLSGKGVIRPSGFHTPRVPNAFGVSCGELESSTPN